MKAEDTDLPIIAFASAAEWEAWLGAQPRTAPGVWLKFAKKTSGIASVSQLEAVEGALCHGWIDGQSNQVDKDFWLLRFTPRKARSRWSEVNRTKALKLIEQGRMAPGGLAEVERAKADGRWEAAYAPQSTIGIPDDLKAALDAAAEAKALFEQLDGRNRYAILHRIHAVKKAETRARRIETYVAMLGRGETIYPRTGKRQPV
ncbi:YdeI/OmpD-associated family protein [Phreatobacter stygius]|uniref:Bacteriocin-protection protein n=1 Tax=Phreatobacter stygius TaxID=1940610 RepID=A0A4D7AX42_9HYPH|nr:YdeI/OmpD-associated family protein [Phreatobacter stygius]QCI64065.1 hypothetical protein E8M01_07270 [Phreatobacter stygius]